MEKMNSNTIMKALDWTYDKALIGLPGVDSAIELAEDYKKAYSNIDKAIDSLVRWQNTKAATSGFLTGLGGAITMPITIPANISSVLYMQIRMIAAIAHLRGYDIKSDQVKTMVYACMAGSAATDILKGSGIRIGVKVGLKAVKNISYKSILEINKKVGFRLLTKFGEKGVVNLGKAVPIFGGLVGAGFDAASTNIIGKVSKKVFMPLYG